jgi:hypothetical protein
MQRWLVATLSQLAPPTRGTTAEPQQVYPEVQKQLEKAKQAGEEQK